MDRQAYDFVIPCYGERLQALQATVGGCLNQSVSADALWVIDDASPDPVRRESLPPDGRIHLIRFDTNRGISAARMAAIRQSHTEYVACVNVDIVPARNWAEACLGYLEEHASVGAVFTRLDAANRRLLTRWRMRLIEEKYDRTTGPARFAPGHAVLFRRRAIDDVRGYDLSIRRFGEDADICERMREANWDTHFVSRSRSVSIQDDTLHYLARKQLIRHGFDVVGAVKTRRGVAVGAVRPRTVVRASVSDLSRHMARNLLKGRFSFVPVDLAVFLLEMIYLRREVRRSGD